MLKIHQQKDIFPVGRQNCQKVISFGHFYPGFFISIMFGGKLDDWMSKNIFLKENAPSSLSRATTDLYEFIPLKNKNKKTTNKKILQHQQHDFFIHENEKI